jgi:hypothetical protein
LQITKKGAAMSAQDPLAAFHAADPPYQQALAELRTLEYARDHALLSARRAGCSPAAIAAETGLRPAEVRRMLERAQRAEDA